MGQNTTEKIVQRFVDDASAPVRSGDYVFIKPRHIMTHDNTAAVIKKFAEIGKSICDPKQPVFILDHDIQNKSAKNLRKYQEIEAFARQHGIDFYPAGRGIGHQVMCEEGYAWPHTLVVASDSHSNMYGGIGCLGTPVTRTDAAVVWVTGKTWWQIPAVVKVNLVGKLQPGVAGKDIIVALCGHFAEDEVLNCAIEFAGEGIANLTIEERLTIANMTTEWGALSGLFPVDERTISWLREKFPQHPAVETISADSDAHYAKTLTIDLATVPPCVCGPNTVKKMRPISLVREEKIKIDKAYLVSCVNSRVEDIAAAAQILENKQIASHVTFYLAAASSLVQQESERRGDWQKLIAAGAKMLPPGCGPCIGLGEGILAENEVGISATNRNFRGRMGSPKASVYLASPAVVAYSAWKGYIDYPGEWRQDIRSEYAECSMSSTTSPLLEGFPAEIQSAAVFCPQNNINTDSIYPGKYTYDEEISADQQARVAMENYDSRFQELAKEGDFLVAGFNFGTGSSREQAATALKYKKIQAVIAGSFSDTYKRNALNNGLLVIESPALVEYLQKLYSALPTISLPGQITVNFADATISYSDRQFPFCPLGRVAQELLLNEGILRWIAQEA